MQPHTRTLREKLHYTLVRLSDLWWLKHKAIPRMRRNLLEMKAIYVDLHMELEETAKRGTVGEDDPIYDKIRELENILPRTEQHLRELEEQLEMTKRLPFTM